MLAHGLVCATAQAEFCPDPEADQPIEARLSSRFEPQPEAAPLESVDIREVDAAGWISLSSTPASEPAPSASYAPFSFEIAPAVSEGPPADDAPRPRWCLSAEGPECGSAPPVQSAELELLVIYQSRTSRPVPSGRALFAGELSFVLRALHPREHLASLDRPPRS